VGPFIVGCSADGGCGISINIPSVINAVRDLFGGGDGCGNNCRERREAERVARCAGSYECIYLDPVIKLMRQARWPGMVLNDHMSQKHYSPYADATGTSPDQFKTVGDILRTSAQANLDRAREAIIADLRAGNLAHIIRLREGEIKGGFDAIIIRLGSCELGVACIEHQTPWLNTETGSVGVRDVVINITVNAHVGEGGYGEALESIAHELEHLSQFNQSLEHVEPGTRGYFWSEAETDARVRGEQVRNYYGR
jgi:hypothetical protein